MHDTIYNGLISWKFLLTQVRYLCEHQWRQNDQSLIRVTRFSGHTLVYCNVAVGKEDFAERIFITIIRLNRELCQRCNGYLQPLQCQAATVEIVLIRIKMFQWRIETFYSYEKNDAVNFITYDTFTLVMR